MITLPKDTKLPDHVAMILDGNRRWARARGLEPWKGHYAGYQAVKTVARTARQLGVHTFTVWAWSTENWDRPQIEIDEIFNLFRNGIEEIEKELKEEKVRFIHLGRKDRFPKDISETLERLERETLKFNKHVFNLAMDYGGRSEIVRATQQIMQSGVKAEDLTEEMFAQYLDTANQPYPYVDLFIRTSGEQRTSGLLPWQMTYAEYYWEPEPLPDFSPEKLAEAILDYSRRRRRFGGNDAVEHLTFKPELSAKFELGWWRLRKIPQGTKFTDFVINYLKEQYGLSKDLAKEAAKLMIESVIAGDDSDWKKAKVPMKKFYKLVKKQLKLAFEPELVASLRIKLWRGMEDKKDATQALEAEKVATNYYAEMYRISNFQAAKAAHLWVLAEAERNMAESGEGEHHWNRAEDYLQKFYHALKDRVA